MSAPIEPTHDHEVYVNLVALPFSGPVPRPHEACTDPTPDEQLHAALRARENEMQQKADEQKQQQQTAGGAVPAEAAAGSASTVQQIKDGAAGAMNELRSLVSQVSLSMQKATTEASSKAHESVRDVDQQQGYDRFASFFGDDLVKKGEVLLANYSCSAMHNGQRVSGQLFITKEYLCFATHFNSIFADAADAVRQAVVRASSSAPAAADKKAVGIKQIIPLANIASIVRSTTLPMVDSTAPYFLPIPAETVVTTALQIYDKEDSKVYQFLGFDSITSKAGSVLSSAVKGTAVDRAYNYLDHAWREAVTVPVAGVNYA